MPYRTQQIFVPPTPAEMAAAEARDYAENHPWERGTTTPVYDMFGEVNSGDLKIELARRMAAQGHDEAIAYEQEQARLKNPRFGMVPFAPGPTNSGQGDNFDLSAPGFFPVNREENIVEDPWIGDRNLVVKGNYPDFSKDQMARGFMPNARWGDLGLDTPEKIDKELFAPIRHQYGVPDPVAARPVVVPPMQIRTTERHGIVGVNPRTGYVSQLRAPAAEVPKPESSIEVPVSFELYGDEVTRRVKMKPADAMEHYSTYTNKQKTNSEVQAVFRPLLTKVAARSPMPGDPFSKNAPAFVPPSVLAPAASAPASASTGLQEGQRVRSRVTGKLGTVKNGIVVPDPEAAQ